MISLYLIELLGILYYIKKIVYILNLYILTIFLKKKKYLNFVSLHYLNNLLNFFFLFYRSYFIIKKSVYHINHSDKVNMSDNKCIFLVILESAEEMYVRHCKEFIVDIDSDRATRLINLE